eukprot:50716-Pyramimonas_sp.AAC.1
MKPCNRKPDCPRGAIQMPLMTPSSARPGRARAGPWPARERCGGRWAHARIRPRTATSSWRGHDPPETGPSSPL